MTQQAASALLRFVCDDAFTVDAQNKVLLFAVFEDESIEVMAPDVAFRVRPRPNDLDRRMALGNLAFQRRFEDGILGGGLQKTKGERDTYGLVGWSNNFLGGDLCFRGV